MSFNLDIIICKVACSSHRAHANLPNQTEVKHLASNRTKSPRDILLDLLSLAAESFARTICYFFSGHEAPLFAIPL